MKFSRYAAAAIALLCGAALQAQTPSPVVGGETLGSAELVRSAGVLAGLFYIDDNLRGPPFGIDRALLHALLDPHFLLEQSIPLQAEESPAVFKGKEHWMVWRRR